MKRCKRCDIEILDDTNLCPLCNSILHGDEQGENLYPKLEDELQKFVLFRKIIYFFSLVIAVLSVMINYYSFNGSYWSLIVLGAIGYVLFTLSYTVTHRTNLGAKVIVQALGILLFTFLIDVVTGAKGWSVRYAIPVMLILADGVICAMMIFDRVRWQGYFMCQIAVTVLGFVPLIIAAVGIGGELPIAVGTCVLLWLVLAASVIFGGRGVKNELKRRFHT